MSILPHSLLLLTGLVLGPSGRLLADAWLGTENRPRWLTELSATSRIGYDSNLYAVDNSRPDAPLADHGVWTGSFGLKVGISVSALADGPKEALQFGYAPTFHWFEGASGENHTRHRFTIQATGRRDAWSWSLDNTATYIDGSDDSPRLNAYNIFGMGFVRDRRSQVQDTGKGWLRYDGAAYFVRATAAALVCDYRTELRAPTEAEAGRLNWVDRDDVNGGFDLGWKVSPAASVFVGGRWGRQQQATTPWMPQSSSNHYTRALLGLEGRPASWLSCSLVGGPDFRRYDAATQCMTDRTPVAWHYAANVTATLGATDSLTFAAKQERWLGSTGQSAYDGKSLALTWQHGFNETWSLLLGAQLQQGKYPSPIVRNDVLYAGQAQLRWRASRQWVVTLDATLQAAGDRLGRPEVTGRDFRRSLVGFGLQYAP